MGQLLSGLLSLLLMTAVLAQPKGATPADSGFDGLQKVKIKGLDLAYVLPGATLAGYTKMLIEPIDVSFHKDFKPEAPGTRRSLTADELQKFRSGVAKLVSDTFVKELAKGGYAVVTEPGPDVLGVRAQIINLYITAPDAVTAGRTHTYTVSAGQMTVVAELADSETGRR